MSLILSSYANLFKGKLVACIEHSNFLKVNGLALSTTQLRAEESDPTN